MVYSYNAYKYAVPAQVVGERFEKIEKKHGKLTNELVLEDARSTSSPLHSLIEWDDKIASHKYRLYQATLLITNLHAEVETDDVVKEVRAFVDTSDGGKKGSFINVTAAFANPDTREIVLKRALRELEMFRQKYQNLKELSEVFEKIEELKEVV